MPTKTVSSPASAGLGRVERVLAYAAITVAVLSVVCIAAYLIGAAANAVSPTGIWPTVAVLPLIGFPIAIILILVFVVLNVRRRSRENRDTTR